jgi:uncharacterized protein with FMN-binding domain
MAKRSSGKKVANSLVAMSSAAVLAVYTAGYERTQSAANRLDAQTVERWAPVPEHAPAEAFPARAAPEKPIAPSTLKEVQSAPKPSEPEATVAAPPTPAPAPIADQAAELSAPKTEAPAPTPTLATPPATPIWKDGTYTGWGSSRHGDIQASVVIEGGRIASATIAQCLTRYSCSVIEKLPPEVAQRQSPEVDFVSGATQSTNAFYFAVVDALGKAKSQTANQAY